MSIILQHFNTSLIYNYKCFAEFRKPKAGVRGKYNFVFRAHDLTVARPVSDTHLDRPSVGPTLPNEVLAQTWANTKVLVILFAIFSQIYLCNWSTGSPEHAAGSGKRAESDGGRGVRCNIILVSRYCTWKPWL
jgi:hypothetical protein